MKTEVIKTELRHCAELAANLDEAGRDLIINNWDVDPEDGITDSFKASPLCWTILVDNKVVGMFGCTEDGNAWLTTAPEIEKVKLRFVRQSRPYIKQMAEYCGGGLVSYAHKDNQLLLRWLEWSGFDIVGRMGDFEICVLRLPQV
ncbi:MAG: hypothetical protein IJ667_13410 [Synergistaceae bacterium]|nr:hypothetical protein [Synergistaceae bacterium]